LNQVGFIINIDYIINIGYINYKSDLIQKLERMFAINNFCQKIYEIFSNHSKSKLHKFKLCIFGSCKRRSVVAYYLKQPKFALS